MPKCFRPVDTLRYYFIYSCNFIIRLIEPIDNIFTWLQVVSLLYSYGNGPYYQVCGKAVLNQHWIIQYAGYRR